MRLLWHFPGFRLQWVYELYLTSISIETIIIYKNISDVIEIKEEKYGLNVFQKLKMILNAKKNPILLTILTENLITFTSTMIPIMAQLLYVIYPIGIWEIIGGVSIAFIQM